MCIEILGECTSERRLHRYLEKELNMEGRIYGVCAFLPLSLTLLMNSRMKDYDILYHIITDSSFPLVLRYLVRPGAFEARDG